MSAKTDKITNFMVPIANPKKVCDNRTCTGFREILFTFLFRLTFYLTSTRYFELTVGPQGAETLRLSLNVMVGYPKTDNCNLQADGDS